MPVDDIIAAYLQL
jgi:hypothetical protein